MSLIIMIYHFSWGRELHPHVTVMCNFFFSFQIYGIINDSSIIRYINYLINLKNEFLFIIVTECYTILITFFGLELRLLIGGL